MRKCDRNISVEDDGRDFEGDPRCEKSATLFYVVDRNRDPHSPRQGYTFLMARCAEHAVAETPGVKLVDFEIYQVAEVMES